MEWKPFARNVHKKAGTLRHSLRHSFYTSRANRWIRKNGREAYGTILNVYEAGGAPYEYGDDDDRDAAHFAISSILDGTLDEPEGWKADEVFITAAIVKDRGIFSTYSRVQKYSPFAIPLLLDIINEPNLSRPDLWAEIIGQSGQAAKAALPALIRLASDSSSTDTRYRTAITALGGKVPDKAKLKPVPGGGSAACSRCDAAKQWWSRKIVSATFSNAATLGASGASVRPGDFAGVCQNCRDGFCLTHSPDITCPNCGTHLKE